MSSSAAKPISLYRSLSDLPETTRGAVLAIGNFDGVHFGHQQVIADARALAAAKNAPLGLMLFDPHPQQFFAPEAPPFRLTRLVTRAALLADLGVDFTLALPFDATMAACEAEDFISDILLTQLGVSAVCVGYDFCFGKGRRGNFAMLKDIGGEMGFETFATEAVLQPNSTSPFSSSAIRNFLRDGDPEQAAQLMGHAFAIEAEVQKGDQRGRTIGFATANMPLHDYVLPKFGVYAVSAEVLDGAFSGQTLKGVANLGMRPTVGTDKPRLESHFFDFEGDLYGANLRVSLLHFIRPEQKFDGLDALKAQISMDIDQAREMLGS
ncbi:bifunctional riboflavin kinase/FAD synthetase [Alphaproteobacteria bacterium]|nr:bifunctional riboflavin kinase/FAD synthetase [Alphaproteobacteria bacterium]MDA8642977.1 bifunctional riboflavin kinase/FAD synthetase [Alphaproteobacteria bacterium]MDA8666339.1 bifunctional riboflavin kinase/FAD synthetase [Alphaproteobacteria bacterium]MDB2540928.1 bifunctional riboflavin kinase/FAD synthetase [Alphaproteobacteria bacterium]MDB2626060.1 bifunctional riboflavin kinase/FAD synthetase [Alphaproteobacteria bacterium]